MKKGADKTKAQIATLIIQFLPYLYPTYIRNFKLLAIFLDCTGRLSELREASQGFMNKDVYSEYINSSQCIFVYMKC